MYEGHRHNIGFRVVDVLASRHGMEIKRRSKGALTASGAIGKEAVILAKPQTFMNVSGDSAAPLARYYKLEPRDMIVVHDDLDIALGKLKIARGAGAGGHNGVQSIIDVMGSGDFFRVRVGIGRPPAGMDAANYVLQNFPRGEEDAARDAIERAADAVETLIAEGIGPAQQKFH